MRAAATTLAAFLAIGWGSGCSGAGERPQESEVPARAPASDPTEAGARSADEPTRRRPPRCAAELQNCRRAGGRVLYVERVDPDGEGDAHVVLASPQGITTPGITLVDLEPRVRPARLPRPGDWVGAAGPVYRGSRGQRQIEARELRVDRARR